MVQDLMPLKEASTSPSPPIRRCKNSRTSKPPCSTTPGNCMPAMLQGPIVSTKSDIYIGYQPNTKKENCCNCDENTVQQKYDKTKKLKTCLFCKNQLSDKLCTPSLGG
jgi:hypothetical protein